MAKSRKQIKKVTKKLKKEVHLPISLPDNKLGATLGAQRSFSLPFLNYFKNSWAELKRVTWPNRKESVRLTIAVILFTAVFTAITAVADAGFSWVVERVLL